MTDVARLTKADVLRIHTATITRFGGTDGLRDNGLLEAALAQPFQGFGDEDLYPTVARKAARYAFGIARNHPFVDGNKRTATAVLGTFLRVDGHPFRPRHDELLSIMLRVAEGSATFEELATWVESQVEPA